MAEGSAYNSASIPTSTLAGVCIYPCTHIHTPTHQTSDKGPFISKETDTWLWRLGASLAYTGPASQKAGLCINVHDDLGLVPRLALVARFYFTRVLMSGWQGPFLDKTMFNDPQAEVKTAYITAILPPRGGQNGPALF